MSALTAAVTRKDVTIYSWHQNFRVANGDTIYMGGYVGLPGSTGGYTSRRGYATAYADQQGIIYAGVAIGATPGDLTTSNTVVGNTSPSSGNIVPEVSVEAGAIIVKRATVTGVSAQTDVLRTSVYLRNDQDLNTTQSQSGAVGKVLYWYTSTTADVLIYGLLDILVG